MKFIEINENVTFRKQDIMAVERIDGENCKILTNIGAYTCNWPYSTLMKFLETEDTDNKNSKNKTSKQNLWGTQHFAG